MLIYRLIIADHSADSTSQSAVRHISHGRVGTDSGAEKALIKWLTGTDEVVDQALNNQQSRK